MKTLNQDIHRNQKTKFLLKSMQFIALLLMGIELGVSYSHLMQLPGTSQLSVTMFIAIQNVLIKYKIELGIVEIGSFLVWGFFIEPINEVINTWTASLFPDNCTLYCDRWHLFHIVRLSLFTVGTSSLIGSVLVKESLSSKLKKTAVRG